MQNGGWTSHLTRVIKRFIDATICSSLNCMTSYFFKYWTESPNNNELIYKSIKSSSI